MPWFFAVPRRGEERWPARTICWLVDQVNWGRGSAGLRRSLCSEERSNHAPRSAPEVRGFFAARGITAKAVRTDSGACGQLAKHRRTRSYRPVHRLFDSLRDAVLM